MFIVILCKYRSVHLKGYGRIHCLEIRLTFIIKMKRYWPWSYSAKVKLHLKSRASHIQNNFAFANIFSPYIFLALRGIFLFSDLIHRERGFYNDVKVIRWHPHRTCDFVILVGITEVSSSPVRAERLFSLPFPPVPSVCSHISHLRWAP